VRESRQGCFLSLCAKGIERCVGRVRVCVEAWIGRDSWYGVCVERDHCTESRYAGEDRGIAIGSRVALRRGVCGNGCGKGGNCERQSRTWYGYVGV